MTADPPSVRAISDADRRDQAVPQWRRDHGVAVLALCDEIDRLRAALASTEAPEPWVTHGPTGRRYRVNVELLNDGDPMPPWLVPADTPHEEGAEP